MEFLLEKVINADFVEVGKLKSGQSLITRPAPCARLITATGASPVQIGISFLPPF